MASGCEKSPKVGVFLLFRALGTIEMPPVEFAVTLPLAELVVSIAANVADVETQQRRGVERSGGKYPWSIVVGTAIPISPEVVKILGTGIDEVIRHPDGDIQTGLRHIDKSRCGTENNRLGRRILSRDRFRRRRWWRI